MELTIKVPGAIVNISGDGQPPLTIMRDVLEGLVLRYIDAEVAKGRDRIEVIDEARRQCEAAQAEVDKRLAAGEPIGDIDAAELLRLADEAVAGPPEEIGTGLYRMADGSIAGDDPDQSHDF